MRANRVISLLAFLLLSITCLGTGARSCWAQPYEFFGSPGQTYSLRNYALQQETAPAPAVLMWNWPKELKDRALVLSQQQVTQVEGKRVLKLTVTDQLPWDRVPFYRSVTIGPDWLPPGADAVVLHVRAIEGSFTLSVGGPTIYFGHSDVFTAPQSVKVDASGASQKMVFSLHDNLIRNFRRAGWAKNSPVIYYTRWVQEPMALYVHAGSAGTLLIEKVELLNQGRGLRERPELQLWERLNTVAQFGDDPAVMERVFRGTFEPVSFDGPPKLARPVWKPSVVTLDRETPSPRKAFLRVVHQGTEEVVFTGLKLQGQREVQGFEVELQVNHPHRSESKAIERVPMDWLLIAAPVDQPLDWTRLEPPASWKSDKANSFDYYLTPELMRDQSFAMYHLRRDVSLDAWANMTLPLDDFVCVHASGSMREAMTQQLPPKSEQVVALGWLPPFGLRQVPTTFGISRVSWMRLKESDHLKAALRTYPQVDPRTVQLVPWGDPKLGQFMQLVPRAAPGPTPGIPPENGVRK